jgi:hypothetical protein
VDVFWDGACVHPGPNFCWCTLSDWLRAPLFGSNKMWHMEQDYEISGLERLKRKFKDQR